MTNTTDKPDQHVGFLRRLLWLGPHTCPWWFGWTFDNPIRRLVHDAEALLRPYVEPGDTVVDIGCGLGYFTIGLARLVGDGGKVIAADIQPRMLERARRRVERLGLTDRVQFHPCAQDDLGITEPVDFALAFWVLHEVEAQQTLLEDLKPLLAPGARLLIVEPKGHVSAQRFDASVALARRVGYEVREAPPMRFSRAVVCSLPAS